MDAIHQFRVEGIAGETIDFAAFAGRKVLVVNVASECGYTPQYAQLQELHEHFAGRLVVVGFPSNDFGGQESGSDADIRQFCTRRYGVTFPLAAKVKIAENPVYRWLQQKARDGGHPGAAVTWNFQKYLLDEQGRLLAVFPPACDPLDPELLKLLEA